MNVENILDEFINKKKYNVIGLDGPWGCGKTTIIYKFIKKYEKKSKIAYISLFGNKNIDEINTKLYFQINKTKNNILNGVSLISKAIDIVPLKAFKVSEALGHILDLHRKNLKISKNIVVFDDFERMLNVGYDEIMGYFNNLLLQGCRIICVMSSNNIINKEKEIYERFKEKVFDRIYKINSLNNDIFEGIFKEIKINDINNKYYLFNNNIRIAIKVKDLYLEIYNHINLKKIKIINNDKYVIFSACTYSILSIFGKETINELEKIFLDNNDKDLVSENDYGYYDSLVYGSLISLHDDFIISNFKKIMRIPKISKELQLTGYLDLIRSIIKIILYNDYSDFDYFFNASKENNFKHLNKEFYFLSDDQKLNYYKEFLKMIKNNELSWNENLTKNLCDICLYSDYEISEQTLKLISKHLVYTERRENKKINYYNLISMRINASGKLRLEKNKNILEKLKRFCEEHDDFLLQNEFDKAVKDDNYIDLTGFLSLKGKNVLWLTKKLQENDFYLPDLKETITFEKWEYCYALSQFISGSNLKSDFLKKLVDLVKNNADNFSLVDRVLTLANVVDNNKYNTLQDLINSN